MSESIRRVNYYKVMVPNKAGQASLLLEGIKNSGVNLLAFSGFPAGKKAQLDFIPEDPAAFERTAKQAGIKITAGKPVFLIQGEDRVGALAEISAKLAAAKINVTALDGISSGAGRYGVIFWVKPKDTAKAARVVGAV